MLRRMTQAKHCQNKGYCLVEAVVLACWVAANMLLYKTVKPAHRGFFCDDESIRYPYLPDTISGDLVMVFTFTIPALIMVGLELASRLQPTRICGGSRNVGGACGGGGWCWMVRAYIAYFFGFTVMTLIVSVLKLTTGQLRPNFIAVCRPDVLFLSPSTDCTNSQYISEYNCTNVEMRKEIDDARQSFPSGHAAMSFLTAIYVMLYVERRVRTRHLHLVKLTLYALLTLYAVWVSATRLRDNRHYLRDIVVGAVLGVVSALASFFGGAVPYCSRDQPGSRDHRGDLECGNRDTDEDCNSSTTNNNNNNNNRSDEDDDVDNGNLDLLETEAPTTPTPLLFNGVSLSSNTGLRIGPLRLEGDKHKFPRRATLQ